MNLRHRLSVHVCTNELFEVNKNEIFNFVCDVLLSSKPSRRQMTRLARKRHRWLSRVTSTYVDCKLFELRAEKKII